MCHQVAILEFCWNSRKNAMNDRQSLCSEMAEELRFILKIKYSLCVHVFKKVRHALSRQQTKARSQTELLPLLSRGESSV